MIAKAVSLYLAVALVGFAAALPTPASGPADAMCACAQEPDDATRLACYDNAVGRAHSPMANPQTAPATAAAVASSAPLTAAATPATPVANPAVRAPVLPITNTAPKPGPAEIVATISQLSRRADGRFVITLSNGQVWLEAETKERFQADVGDAVHIRTGLLGARYLRTSRGIDVRVTEIGGGGGN